MLYTEIELANTKTMYVLKTKLTLTAYSPKLEHL